MELLSPNNIQSSDDFSYDIRMGACMMPLIGET